jgi:hypothetical protein
MQQIPMVTDIADAIIGFILSLPIAAIVHAASFEVPSGGSLFGFYFLGLSSASGSRKTARRRTSSIGAVSGV